MALGDENDSAPNHGYGVPGGPSRLGGEGSNGGGDQGGAAPAGGAGQHLNIKVTDNNNEVFFKIRRTTKLEKLMNAFCDRQGKQLNQVRFMFDGQRVQPNDTPDSVRRLCLFYPGFVVCARPS